MPSGFIKRFQVKYEVEGRYLFVQFTIKGVYEMKYKTNLNVTCISKKYTLLLQMEKRIHPGKEGIFHNKHIKSWNIQSTTDYNLLVHRFCFINFQSSRWYNDGFCCNYYLHCVFRCRYISIILDLFIGSTSYKELMIFSN